MDASVSKSIQGKRLLACSLILLSCYLLKLFYQHADSESLGWILAPTALLAEILSGIRFHHELGTGWVNFDHMVVIAPACSGVNFMIIAYSMSACMSVFFRTTLKEMALLACFAGFFSFLVTVLANAVRIWLSIRLFQIAADSSWLSPSEAHRILGVTVYFLFLLFYYQSLSFIFHKMHGTGLGGVLTRQGKGLFMVPLCWYLLFSLGIPYLRSSARVSWKFADHAQAVISTCALLTVLVFLLTLVVRYLYCRLGLKEKRVDILR